MTILLAIWSGSIQTHPIMNVIPESSGKLTDHIALQFIALGPREADAERALRSRSRH
jgi:hypothetical protein